MAMTAEHVPQNDACKDDVCVARPLEVNNMAENVKSGPAGPAGPHFDSSLGEKALWGRIVQVSPRKPWMNRDRFVLSSNHASALQRSMLQLIGYGLGGACDASMDDLNSTEEAGPSPLPLGHHVDFPSASGIEVTKGPLGQSFANAVGKAMAEAHLAARFNKDGYPLFDYNTYCLAGDGCMMEGVASEAASLAGHLKLHKLIVFYDDSKAATGSVVDLSFSEDVGARFAAYGWNVLHVENHEMTSSNVFEKAVGQAKSQTEKPSIIIVRTIVDSSCAAGMEGICKAQGEIASNMDIRNDRCNIDQPRKINAFTDRKETTLLDRKLGLISKDSVLPKYNVLEKLQEIGAKGDRMAQEWEAMLQGYVQRFRASDPALVEDLERRMSGKLLVETWEAKVAEYLSKEQKATNSNLKTLSNTFEVADDDSDSSQECKRRKISPNEKPKYKAGRVYVAEVLKNIVATNPAVIGGSPDVASSCGGHWPELQGHFLPPSFAQQLPGAGYAGRYIHFGVREHACLAILNGLSSSSALVPYCTLFTIFYQYALPAIRMACISKSPVLYIGTHDSVDVGEDGPTHQPVEVLPQLRAMPNLLVIRPANLEECVGAFHVFAAQHSEDARCAHRGPVFVMTSRGELGLPYKGNTKLKAQDGVWKGAYVLHDCIDEVSSSCRAGLAIPDIVLIGSGQDVALVMKAKEILLNWSHAFTERLSKNGFEGFPHVNDEAVPALLKVRVVSMPCWELFDEQDREYQDNVLCSRYRQVLRVYVEKAATKDTGHDKYADLSVLMPSYGLSGKAVDVERKLEFTPEFIAAKVWASWLQRRRVLSQAGDAADRGLKTWVSHLGRRAGRR